MHIEALLSEKLYSCPSGKNKEGNVLSQRKLQSNGTEKNNTGEHFTWLDKCIGFPNNNKNF